MKKKGLILISLFLTLFQLVGCLDKKILDDVQLATLVGYDLIEDDLIQATAVAPQYKRDNSVENLAFTASSTLSKEIRDKLDRQSSRPFVSGKIVVSLYSIELAKKGIAELIDTFERDPSVGSRLYLVIAEGDMNKELKVQFGDIDNGMFLTKMIEHNIQNGMIPKTNLHQFTKSLYDEGSDPFLPYLKLQGKKTNIEGIALFDDDKYVGLLSAEDSFVFKILVEKSSTDSTFAVKMGEGDEEATVYNMSSDRKFEVRDPMTSPHIKIKIDTKSTIREYSGKDITKDIIRDIEKKLEEDVKTKAQEMIERFKEQGIDPIGFGNQVKTRTRSWDKKKWDDLYPNSTFEVDVDVKIIETGVIK